MSALPVQSTTMKGMATHAGDVYLFSASGVDRYRPSIAGWTRVGFAALKNVTCGAVNDVGVWLGTSDRGVWFMPSPIGDGTSTLTNIYRETGQGTQITVLDDEIKGMCALGQRLLVITAAGANYFPSPASSWTYALTGMPGACAMNATKIAYAVAAALHVRNNPTANWTTSGTTVLTTASSPAIASNTIRDLKYGTDLFVATAAGLNIYDNTDVTTIAAATNITCCWPKSTATQATGIVAYGTAAAAKLYNIAGSAELDSISNATEAVWVDDLAEALVYDNNLEAYTQVTAISPGADVAGVRRAWTLYFEIADSLHGLDAETLAVTVNGAGVTETITELASPFSSGFSSGFAFGSLAVSYTPGSPSGYRERVTVTIACTDGAGNAISHTFSFTTATQANTEPTRNAPPNVVVIKDLSLAASAAEESYAGVNVNWSEEISAALIVSEAQAQAVGTVVVENAVYHRHVRTLRVLATDANGDASLALKQGNVITFTCSALGESVKKAEVLAVQRNVDETLDGCQEYTLLVGYYEAYA